MMSRISWCPTTRGKPHLVDEENFEYRLNKRNKGRIFYLCRKYDELRCKAMVSIQICIKIGILGRIKIKNNNCVFECLRRNSDYYFLYKTYHSRIQTPEEQTEQSQSKNISNLPLNLMSKMETSTDWWWQSCTRSNTNAI